MKKIAGLVLFVFFSNSMPRAQENKDFLKNNPGGIKNKDAVEIYEKYSLKPFTDFWTGYGYTRNSDGKRFNTNGFGLNPELVNLLMESPSARPYMRKYNNEILAGNILYWTGMGSMIVDLVLVLTSTITNYNASGQIIYWSLLGGGFATSMVGAGFIASAQNNLQQAIWQYNKDIISGETRVSQTNEPHFNLAFSTKF